MKKIFLLLAVTSLFSCSSSKEEKKQINNINKEILYDDMFTEVSKMRVDSIQYIVVRTGSGGVAIIRHSK